MLSKWYKDDFHNTQENIVELKMKHDQSYETNGLEALQDLFTKEVWIVNDRNNQIWENVISQKERLSVIFYFSVVEIKNSIK